MSERSAAVPKREVKRYAFPRLEKVPRTRLALLRRLEWLLPEGLLNDELGEPVRERLRKVFDQEANLWLDYVHAVPQSGLLKMINEPTVLGAISASPHGARGLIEVELDLAHSLIDMLLGAARESALVRPLTEIEEGVISYVLLETFKALSPPSPEPGRHRLRLERMLRSLSEGVEVLGDETSIAVVEFKALIGSAAGYMRLMLPASAIREAAAPEDTPTRRELRRARLEKNLGRLAMVRVPLRVEIGGAELTGGDVLALRPGDVMLLDSLYFRSDQGDGGPAIVKVGRGQLGYLEASVACGDDGRYRAAVEKVVIEPPPPSRILEREEAEAPPEQAAREEAARAQATDEQDEERAEAENTEEHLDEHLPTSPGARLPWEFEGRHDVKDKGEAQPEQDAAELLNDLPLQVVVELGRVPVTAEDLVSLHVGKILELDKGPGDPVDLSVNGKIIARGEVVEIEGQLGVRISSLSQ